MEYEDNGIESASVNRRREGLSSVPLDVEYEDNSLE